ncbi:VOC family protein [Lentzea chajnantorensis]
MGVAEPEVSVDFFAGVLGWTVIAEPGGSFSGWVGDRLAARVAVGESGWRVVFGDDGARELGDGSCVDVGRVLHGPWAPAPRAGEPCWVELVVERPDDAFWAGALGWDVEARSEDFAVFLAARQGDRRAVAGRLRTGRAPGWMTYFAVDSVEDACARVSELDGRVLLGPTTVPTGLVASISGPHGGACAVLERPRGWGGAWAV